VRNEKEEEMIKCRMLLALCLSVVPAVAQGVPNSSQLINTYPEAISGLGLFGVRNRVEVFDGSGGFSKALLDAVSSDSNFINVRPSGFERPFNLGIAVQLSSLPIASPASGVIFQEDKATGAMLPAADSLGPILTERAETIGKRRFYMGFTRQQFRFDKIEGQPLGSVTNLYVGGDPTNITQNGKLQTTAPMVYGTQVDLRLDQNVAFFTYGLTNRIDISGALTSVRSSMSVIGYNAREVNSGNPGDGGTCWCAATLDVRASKSDASGLGLPGLHRDGVFGSSFHSSSGIGDTLIRVKGTLLEKPRYALAIGSDFRLPTGDAENYHGSGAFGFKPFAALSLHSRTSGRFRFSPNFNIGYQVSGSSVLAGDPVLNKKERLPDQFTWSAGTAVGISRRLTFVADILGNRVINSYRLEQATVPGRGTSAGVATGLTLASNKQSFSMNSGSFGIKTKSLGNLVFTGNVLVAFDNNGLRDKYIPLVGLGYSF
jgi:hypothetical protein